MKWSAATWEQTRCSILQHCGADGQPFTAAAGACTTTLCYSAEQEPADGLGSSRAALMGAGAGAGTVAWPRPSPPSALDPRCRRCCRTLWRLRLLLQQGGQRLVPQVPPREKVQHQPARAACLRTGRAAVGEEAGVGIACSATGAASQLQQGLLRTGRLVFSCGGLPWRYSAAAAPPLLAPPDGWSPACGWQTAAPLPPRPTRRQARTAWGTPCCQAPRWCWEKSRRVGWRGALVCM